MCSWQMAVWLLLGFWCLGCSWCSLVVVIVVLSVARAALGVMATAARGMGVAADIATLSRGPVAISCGEAMTIGGGVSGCV